MVVNPARFNKERWDFGKQNELELLPFLENYLGEPITETKKVYDTIDGTTSTKDIEIKSRSPSYDWDTWFMKENGWLLPACKIDHAKHSGKPFHCFYYWKKDGSIWEWVYKPEDMEGLIAYIPSFHKEKQYHYDIPFRYWKRLN
jgi:hypothetical protein